MSQSDPNPAAPSDAGTASDAESRQNSTPPTEQIATFLRLLFREGDVFEVRALKTKDRPASSFTSTVSGYYTHASIEKAAADIAALDARNIAPGIYVTLNPVECGLLGRSAKGLRFKAEVTTKDSEVVVRRWVLLDFDPVRPSGISSTASEVVAAQERAATVMAALRADDWPEPIVGLSGNGCHLLYAIDEPAADGGLVEGVLAGLAARFDDDLVKIDRSVFNPSRITKVFGTMARKGDPVVGVVGVEDRPHRRAVLLSAPAAIHPVPRARLESVAASPNPAPRAAPIRNTAAQAVTKSASAFERFEHTADGVSAYLARHGVRVTGIRTKGTTTWLDLDRCPVVPDCTSTGGSDISVGVGDDGKIGYKNQHNRGSGLQWRDVREALEPGYKAWAEAGPSRSGVNGPPPPVELHEQWKPPLPLHDGSGAVPFPVRDAFPPPLAPIQDFVLAVAEHSQVPVDAPAMLLLPMASVSMAQKIEIDLGNWREPCAIWTVVLMNSAERKSATLGQMQGPILEWEREGAADLAPIIAREQAERAIEEKRLDVLRRKAAGGKSGADDAKREAIELAEKLASQAITTVPRLITTEPTPEALSALLAENRERALVAAAEADAFDVMMGRYNERGTPNLGIYLAGHSGDPCRIDRRGRPPIMLHRPTLSMGMIVQPEGVRGMFANRAARGRGLLARFLASAPQSRLGHRKITPDAVPLRMSSLYERAMRWMLKQQIPSDAPSLIVLSPPAHGIFTDFRAWLEPELARGGGLADQREWAGKLAGAIARICLVLHGLKAAVERREAGLSEAVDQATMQAALAWAPYLIAHERMVAGVVGADPENGTADRVLAWMEKTQEDSFTKRDAFTALRNAAIKQVGDLDAALRILMELGYIRPDLSGPQAAGPGRKPSPVYLVNPLWKRGAGGAQ